MKSEKNKNYETVAKEVDELLEKAAPKGKTGHKKTDREERKKRIHHFKKLMEILSGTDKPLFPGEDDW